MIDVSIRLRRGIYVDNLLIVKRILKNNPKSIFNPDIGGNTSLHLAAEWGRLDIVQYLVTQTAHEADGVSKNGMDYTPLMLAAREGHEDVVAFLAGKFEQCIDWRNRQGYTALMLAAMGGRDGVVNILLGQGADKEVSDILGNTALHYASAYGHLKVIRTLVERGASVDHQNRQGWMPISYSCTFEAQRYFEQLVQDREVRWLQAGASAADRPRAVTPVPPPPRGEWPTTASSAVAAAAAAAAGRSRASSGS